jgi:hypothetical protein
MDNGTEQYSQYRDGTIDLHVMCHSVCAIILFSRYADIVVHRLLASSLGIAPLPAAVQDRTRVHDMAEVINHRHRMAQLVSRASGELFTLLYFSGRDVVEDAMVVAVKSNGLRIMVPRYGIESGITLWSEPAFDEEQKGAVTAATAGAKNPWILDEVGMTLRGPGGVQYKIFEQIRVRIFVQEAKSRRKWLQVELVDKDTPVSSRPTELIAKHVAASVKPESESASAAAAISTPNSIGKTAGKKREADQMEANGSKGTDAAPATKSAKKQQQAQDAAATADTSSAQTKKKQKL